VETLVGWIAPAATMIAAMMTAANLGARFTGWGFVVFTVGSIAWSVVGLTSGQTNLLATNAFLTLVNVVGVWRWLGREARYQDDAAAVAEQTERSAKPSLSPLGALTGENVRDASGDIVGQIVDVLIDRDDGRVGALLVRRGGVGGIGERVVLLKRENFSMDARGVASRLDDAALDRLPEAREAA
jgi:sporulation protein YlmC with PRC-barrel domain